MEGVARLVQIRPLGSPGSHSGHIDGALASAETIEDLERFDWPTPDCFDYGPLKDQLRKYEGYALRYGFADTLERPSLVRGKEPFYCDMALRLSISPTFGT